MFIRRFVVGVATVLLFLAASCTDNITIRAHASVTDLEVDGESIGALDAGQEADVEVSGRVLVTWKYEGSSESDYMKDGEDGAVWHLYASYGSYDEW